jgi:hypothetical protein
MHYDQLACDALGDYFLHLVSKESRYLLINPIEFILDSETKQQMNDNHQ